MALDMPLGKPIFHPQVQLLAKLFEGRFDLFLKVSDLSAMQKVAPFFVVFVNYFAKLSYHDFVAASIVVINYYSDHKICLCSVTLTAAKGIDSSAPAGPQNNR
jgi:hypothetical protein